MTHGTNVNCMGMEEDENNFFPVESKDFNKKETISIMAHAR